VLASDLLIICGRKTISSKILVTVTKELKRLSLNVLCVQNQPQMEIHEDGFYALEVVNFVRRALNEEIELEFPDLLEFARAKVCSDPRDRVFAMLGMAERVSRTGYRLHIRRNPPKTLSRPTSIAQRPA